MAAAMAVQKAVRLARNSAERRAGTKAKKLAARWVVQTDVRMGARSAGVWGRHLVAL